MTVPTSSRSISTMYAKTLPNLLIGSQTRVIYQGFIGKQATTDAQESLAWGTKIVGGVTPGRDGLHLGLPVLPSVRQAMEKLKPDATAIYVAARHAAAAIQEAIKAEVPLIVAVAEHIPLYDMLRIHVMLRAQSKSRLVGPNSPGIISAIGRCRTGFQPLPCFLPGRIGIVAKSGTLSYETVASTTRAGFGQSLCIGVGGDVVPGTDLREALEVLGHDESTDAIALAGEIGGTAGMDAASWIQAYHSRTKSPKPIVGLIAGVIEAPNRVMGHAGAFTTAGEPDALAKIAALEEAGVTIISYPAKFGEVLRARLQVHAIPLRSGSRSGTLTRRQFHTAAERQQRYFYLPEDKCLDLLRTAGQVNCATYTGHGVRRLLAVGIDRSARSPCILASPTIEQDQLIQTIQRSPLDTTVDTLREVVRSLVSTFHEGEAFLLTTHLFGFDDAAFNSSGRQGVIRDVATGTNRLNNEAERSGIVYIRLWGDGPVGTLVNGAGLAMNTATSETVKRGFELILEDPRVRVIFVNIFGGLTLGDMIAKGIILAFNELSLKIPIVVRIKGTNEKEGQQLIADSGLPLYAIDDFHLAAAKAIELSLSTSGRPDIS
ncbi:succinyl-CoA synthetase-like protein [Podospora didyma]|uniref:Succinyl-CoA synthetase-like protein n=1 Tax=Podospora didyma TaxID=330526 RepID=A0AAE0P7Q3_9PEZI|nr:succinyl-CoA synthetase-like protein [Podospora didyma]